MSTESNEQYRAGFEAWARKERYRIEHEGDGYYWPVTDGAWEIWTAAKREASTEPSRLPTDDEIERAALKHVAVGWEQMCAVETKMGSPRPNYREHAQFVRLKAFAHEFAGGSAGALTDDAKDAARYRFMRSEATGDFIRFVPYGKPIEIDEAIDAAIEAHTKAGSQS